jgi:hypothetical protein
LVCGLAVVALLATIDVVGAVVDERRVVDVDGFSLSPDIALLGIAEFPAACDFFPEFHSKSISNSLSSA